MARLKAAARKVWRYKTSEIPAPLLDEYRGWLSAVRGSHYTAANTGREAAMDNGIFRMTGIEQPTLAVAHVFSERISVLLKAKPAGQASEWGEPAQFVLCGDATESEFSFSLALLSH